MSYTKTAWSNSEPPAINAANLNKIEDGLEAALGYTDKAALVAYGVPTYTFSARIDEHSGSGSIWKWVESSDYADTLDTTICGVFILVSGTAGWERVFDNEFDARWFGVIPTGAIDQTTVIQGLLDYADAHGGHSIIFPKGSFGGNNIRVPAWSIIKGQGDRLTNFFGFDDNQSVFVMNPKGTEPETYQSILNVEMSDFRITGGSVGLDFREQTSSGVNTSKFKNIVFLNQTEWCAIFYNLISCKMDNLRFDGAPNGVKTLGGYTNYTEFDFCTWVGISGQEILGESLGFEAVSFNVCRFEGHGDYVVGDLETELANNFHIELPSTRSVSFNGCYFESNHLNLYKENGSSNTTQLTNCHFTGSYAAAGAGGGRVSSGFYSKGVISFSSCDASAGVHGVNNEFKFLDKGGNFGICAFEQKYTEFSGWSGDGLTTNEGKNEGTGTGRTRLTSKLVTEYPSSLTLPLLKFERVTVSGSSSNTPLMSGKVSFNYIARVSGGITKVYKQTADVQVYSVGIASMACIISNVSEISNLGFGDTMTLVASDAAKGEITLNAVFTGESESSITNTPHIVWDIDAVSIAPSTEESDIIQVTSKF